MGIATAWNRVAASLRDASADDPDLTRILEKEHSDRFRGRARWVLLATMVVFVVSLFVIDTRVLSRRDALVIRLPELVSTGLVYWWMREGRALRSLEWAMVGQWTVIAALSSWGFTRTPTEMLPSKVISLVVSVLLVQLIVGLRTWANLATAFVAFLALLPVPFLGARQLFVVAMTGAGFSSILIVVYSVGRARMERSELSARRALEVANERLRTEDELRRRLFTNLAHDFRTPLAVIRGEAALLRETLADELVADPLRRVERNAAALADLTDQLLDLARLEAGQMAARAMPCDLAAVARDVAAQLAPARTSRIEVSAPKSTCAIVDPKHVTRILGNLVANALRQKGEDGAPSRVVIRISRESREGRDGELAIVDVVDDGQGVPVSRREAIFKRFVSFDRDGNTASGIGLPLARELARLNGGELTLLDTQALERSETTFRLTLRATDEAPVGHEGLDVGSLGEVVTAAAVPSGGRRRVVVVEDNADMRSVLERALGRVFLVEALENVEEARARLTGPPPAALVSDVLLPDGNGYDVLAMVRALREWEGVPVLLLSALGSSDERARGLAAGADDYVAKPFAPAELVRRILSAVERAEGFKKKLDGQRETLLMEVHDGVSASLARASMILSEDGVDATNLGYARQAIRDGLDEVRAIPRVLAPRPIRFDELAAEMRRAMGDACAAQKLALDIEIIDVDASSSPLSAASAHVIRRAAREATTNAIKHAKASRLRCRLRAEGGFLHLRVEDDGRGFPAEIVPGQGQGIMRRRAARVGGVVETGNLAEGGAFVDVRVPRAP